MSESAGHQNLSEILFKPRFKYAETSTISNSGCELPPMGVVDPTLDFTASWYRPVRRFMWTLQGGNLLDIEEALANICVSDAERTRPGCFDTVREYGPGNWIYEFNYFAQRRENRGRELEDQGRILPASHNYRMAARYYSIAAYPYLKGDVLAAESLLHSRHIYKRMIDIDPTNGEVVEESFTVQGRKVSGLLHLPDKKKPHPCVILAGSYEQSAVDFYRFYTNFLFPRGMAIFVVDMPGAGSSARLTLTPELSVVIDAALDHLRGLRYIDSTRLGLCGTRIAGTACLRSAILRPGDVRGVALISPAVHALFTSSELLHMLPLCLRSSYANRLDLNASSWDTVIPQLKAYSPKVQGLLSASGRCGVPCYVITSRASFVTAEDISLLEANFKNITVETLENTGFSRFLLNSLDKCAAFFENLLF